MKIPTSHPAFTLAEVLIALALIGVMAAFAIPKVLQATEEAHKKAIMREAVGEISKLVQEWYLFNDLPQTAEEVDTRLQQKLNLLSYDGSRLSSEDNLLNYYYTLKNGASIRMKKGNIGIVMFSVDYNGFGTLPDKLGEDRVTFFANVQQTAHCGVNPGGVRPYNPTVSAECQTTASEDSLQLIYDTFQKLIVN